LVKNQLYISNFI